MRLGNSLEWNSTPEFNMNKNTEVRTIGLSYGVIAKIQDLNHADIKLFDEIRAKIDKTNHGAGSF